MRKKKRKDRKVTPNVTTLSNNACKVLEEITLYGIAMHMRRGAGYGVKRPRIFREEDLFISR